MSCRSSDNAARVVVPTSDEAVRHAALNQQPIAYWDTHGVFERLYRAGITPPPAVDMKIECALLTLSPTKLPDPSKATIYQAFGVRNDQSLWDTLRALYAQEGIPLEEAFARGEAIRHSARLYHHSLGFPVDTQRLNALRAHNTPLQRQVCGEVNKHYGLPIYNLRKPDPRLDHRAIGRLALRLGITDWARTENGLLSTEDEVLKRLCEYYPELERFRASRQIRHALRGMNQWAVLERDGYIKPRVHMFQQRTSRNTPKSSEGFLLNLSPALRNLLIRPHPDRVFIGLDWSQQEILIAGVLSEDRRLLEAYFSEDTYLEVARRCGLEPNQTHRQVCKAIMLGIGYGMGEASLVRRVQAVSTLPPDEAERLARQVYAWHKRYFTAYWGFVETTLKQARREGQLVLEDGWRLFVDHKTKNTQIRNWYFQSTGALLMREAVARMPTAIDVVCSHHDAFYVNADVGEAQAVMGAVGRAMDNASEDLLGVVMKRETHIYDHANGYFDKRGEYWANKIKAMLGQNCLVGS
jgi:DNA polymerase I-like protein with 3'-5' exonuclease and polymerase domains